MPKIIQSVVISLLLVATGLSAAEVKVIALFTNKALIQVDGQQKIIKKGETYKGVKLLSASGRGAVVDIDGREVNLGLNQSIAGNFKKPERGSTKIYPDSMGMYFTDGTINGHLTRFLVDTGATFVTMSGDKARSLGIDFYKGTPSRAQTASAVVPTWQIELNSVTVGTIKLRNVAATVIEGGQPYEVLLGNSFLGQTSLQRAGAVLEIKKRY